MATGFTALDALNNITKAGVKEAPTAKFRTKDISIFKMYRNEKNFYSIAQIEELADDILRHGLKQNLEIKYAPCDKGEYVIIAGERRWEALKLLVSQEHKEFEIATCKITAPKSEWEETLEIIIANAYRDKTEPELLEEEIRLKATLQEVKAAGKTIPGYDLKHGKIRSIIAKIMKKSETKVQQYESIGTRLIPEFLEKFKGENIGFSTAYELSTLPEEEQRTLLEKYADTDISHKEVKETKEEKKKVDAVSESDTVEELKKKDGAVRPEEEPEEKEAAGIKQKDMMMQPEKRDADNDWKEKKPEPKPIELPKKDAVYREKAGVSLLKEITEGSRRYLVTKMRHKYRVGNTLILQEHEKGIPTGNIVKIQIAHMTDDSGGIIPGYCVIGFLDFVVDKEDMENEVI